MFKINWIAVFCIISLALSLFSIYEISKNRRMAFVDIGVVFEAFEMKKELQKKYTKETLPAQQEVDSLEQMVATLNTNYQSNPNEQLGVELRSTYEKLQAVKSAADAKTSELKSKYDEQVQKRLQQYLIDFAKNEGLSMLLSTIDGNTVIHGTSGFDATTDAIEFVNKKYMANE